MRIISQDGMIDIPYENFTFARTGGCYIVAIRDAIARPDEIVKGVVAKYSDESKAKRAMDMLREEYQFGKQFETICCGTTDYPRRPLYYFQFPTDEELEV